jgi:hypothetical protein
MGAGLSGKILFDFALFRDRVSKFVETGGIGRTGSGPVLLLDLQIDFFTMHRNIARGGDSQPNLVAANFNHGNFDLVADFDALV